MDEEALVHSVHLCYWTTCLIRSDYHPSLLAMANKIVVESSDGVTYSLDEEAASLSITIKNMWEDLEGVCDDGTAIPLPNVCGETLERVVSFCTMYASHVDGEDDGKESSDSASSQWKCDVLLDADEHTIYQLMLAANYLDIKPLLDLTCLCVAERIEGKSSEELCAFFGLTNDFTPEEHKQLDEDHPWCAEKKYASY